MPDLFLDLHRDDSDEQPAPELSRVLIGAEERDLLRTARFTETKLIPWGSNYSFAVALRAPSGVEHLAIYKPRRGEAPLHDFPDGTLYLRECAAFVLSEALGWNIVPTTIVRDGPHGIGSLQLYIQPMPGSEEDHHFWGACAPDVERLVLFDHVANNADRKIGHCLRDHQGKVWGIDHGLTFNRYPKLRTVLWQFVGSPISPSLLSDLRCLRATEDLLREDFRSCLATAEIDALVGRIDQLLDTETYPPLNPRRNVPYGWW